MAYIPKINFREDLLRSMNYMKIASDDFFSRTSVFIYLASTYFRESKNQQMNTIHVIQ